MRIFFMSKESKSKAKPSGYCSKRSMICAELLQESYDILIEGNENLCDYFQAKRKSS